MSAVTIEELNQFFAKTFAERQETAPEVTDIRRGFIRLELPVTHEHLRPPGIINGPTQMALADRAAYCAIFTELGLLRMAVTSNLNIDFLRPCLGNRLIADAEIVKLGRTLCVISVDMRGSDHEKVASRATVTYALPKTD